MQHWHYFYHGLNVTSELPFPEWHVFAHPATGRDSDVFISIQSFPLSGIAESILAAAGQLAVIEGGEYGLRIPNVGDFRVQEGRRIIITPAPGAELTALRSYALGSVWAALCYQRGLFVIHASAVSFKNAAVVFCGQSGKGKSTTAALLSAHGHSIVSDDLCCFQLPPAGPPLLYPSAPRVKLLTETLRALGWNQDDAEADPLWSGKFRFLLNTDWGSEPIPVKAIYVLEWGDLSIRDCSGITALRKFLPAATYRSRVIEHLGQLGNFSRRCLQFLEHVPLFEFSRPRSLLAVQDSGHFLTEHIARL